MTENSSHTEGEARKKPQHNSAAAVDATVLTDGGQDTAKVIGHNTDEDGETYGVWGEVDSTDGYGLGTPDDAEIGGVLKAVGLAGDLTAGEEVSELAGDGLTIDEGSLATTGDVTPGRYLAENTELDFTGPAEWENAGDTETNAATGEAATVAGGENNEASGAHAVVGGGGGFQPNKASEDHATVAGGRGNTAGGFYTSIGGGIENEIDSTTSRTTIAGGAENEIYSGANFATIGGGNDNEIWENSGGVIGGGMRNEVRGSYGVIGGGVDNRVVGSFAALGGGSENNVTGQFATIAGGGGFSDEDGNVASGDYSAISGGESNETSGDYSAIGGGEGNAAVTDHATVGGGYNNEASGSYATVPGGHSSTASGDYSFAVGREATAEHNGSFVVGDSSSTEITSDAKDTAYFQMDIHADDIKTNSSVAVKENVGPVSPTDVLDKVTDLSVATWEFEHREGRHIGPMAEDFHDQFDVGEETTISNIDANGVAFAAIQGLAERLEETREELAANAKHIEELEEKTERIEELEEKAERIDDLEKRLQALEG